MMLPKRSYRMTDKGKLSVIRARSGETRSPIAWASPLVGDGEDEHRVFVLDRVDDGVGKATEKVAAGAVDIGWTPERIGSDASEGFEQSLLKVTREVGLFGSVPLKRSQHFLFGLRMETGGHLALGCQFLSRSMAWSRGMPSTFPLRKSPIRR